MSNNDNLEAEDIWGTSVSRQSETGASGLTQQQSEEEKDDVELDSETLAMSTNELRQRIRLLDNEIRIMRSDIQRITHESRGQRDRITENLEKVKLNKQLPYLVGNVVEVLEPDAEDGGSVTLYYYHIIV